MPKSTYLGLCASTLILGLIAASPVMAKSSDTYVLDKGHVHLEISAVRDDIVRIRMSEHKKARDESFAVSSEVRKAHLTLHVSTDHKLISLATSSLIVKLDPKTLAIRITDMQGQVLLADASGQAVRFDGQGFHMRKVMPQNAHYFGLGDKTGPLDRRDQAFSLWNTDNFGFGDYTDPLYKSIPFILGLDNTGKSFGLFMDNTWRSYFDFGKSERDTLNIGAEGGDIDYYVMTGKGPKDIISAYGYLTGHAPLTPEWALGFQQSHWSYMTQGEVKSIADTLRKDHIPADVLYMDIDYQDHNKPFSVNTQAFPDLKALVSDLKAQDLHLVLITDLHIAHAPNQQYKPYDSGEASDIFVKNPDGSDFVGKVWPGDAVFPDFSRKVARQWWGQQYKDFAKLGVGGFWNDMDEPSVFEVATKTMPLDVVHTIEDDGFTTRKASHAEMHNVYGMLNSRATYEGALVNTPNTRPFVLTRASYAGGQKYAATWTGDNSSTYAHLKLATYMLVNLGLSGFSYVGDDIGGFAGNQPSADLLTRWIEIGAFNPIFRDHYQKDKPAQEVWVNGPDHEAIRRRYIEERYRLMPYIYALAEENSRNGLPLMRPVFLSYPEVVAKGDHLGGTDDQFMLGDNLLIAPSSAPESPQAYDISLPSKGWYDYWTSQRLDEAAIKETPRLDHLPVFVRPGAILAKQPLVQSTMQTPSGPLEIHVYLGPDCQGHLYFDDGVSFDYKKGAYLRQNISCQSNAALDKVSLDFGPREGQYHAWWSQIRLIIHGYRGQGAHITQDEHALTGQWDVTNQTLSLDLADLAHQSHLEIKS